MNPQLAQNLGGEVKFGDSANHIQIAEQFVGVHHRIINLYVSISIFSRLSSKIIRFWHFRLAITYRLLLRGTEKRQRNACERLALENGMPKWQKVLKLLSTRISMMKA